MLVRLIYTSRAPSPHPNDLSNILHTSRTMNPRFGITGALCFLDGAYMQYLEGEEPEVRALYAAIERDERHQSPRLLELTRIQVRFFPAWSMALLKWDERLETIFQGFATGQALDLYETPEQEAAVIFRALARTPNWRAA
ncbi:BLUF domain-containing protein [Variovorax sp.]|uniref:BLUF domain-containing protein n=1 Tax=Variovorax sp. TaxID=1871043 RepID=UPI003BA8F16C